MQTFLPYDDFDLVGQVLDRQRLGKQRVEVLQLLKALEKRRAGEMTGWANHAATRMWEGYEGGLSYYGIRICKAWIARGYNDTCTAKIAALADPDPDDMPPWMGWSDFHISHQSNLLRKAPDHYGPYFPGVPDDLEYVWPSGITSRRRPTTTNGQR